MADDRRQLKWKDLDGQERYQVVELIRKGDVKPVYLVFGTEAYLVRESAEAIGRALAEATGAEIARVDAAGGDAHLGAEAVARVIRTLGSVE